MGDREKKQHKGLVESACKTANNAARLEIFILEHLRAYGANTRDVIAAIQEAKQGKFQNLQRLFDCPTLSHHPELG